MTAPPQAAMVDLSFEILGGELPGEHRLALAEAVAAVLPWWAEPQQPAPGLHRLNLSRGSGTALLSRRTRLALRVPRERAVDAHRLAGRRLPLGTQGLHLGEGQQRELLPWGTLYAHLVIQAVAPACGEAAFQQALESELRLLGVQARAICGREQALEPALAGAARRGQGVMLDGLSAADALRVMDHGIGPHRAWGCGIFVPHKSAAAVGAPA